MISDSGIKPYAFNDLLRIESSHFGIGIKLIKECNSERQICICKKFDCFCLCGIRKQCRNILFQCTFLQKVCKDPRSL